MRFFLFFHSGGGGGGAKCIFYHSVETQGWGKHTLTCSPASGDLMASSDEGLDTILPKNVWQNLIQLATMVVFGRVIDLSHQSSWHNGASLSFEGCPHERFINYLTLAFSY